MTKIKEMMTELEKDLKKTLEEIESMTELEKISIFINCILAIPLLCVIQVIIVLKNLIKYFKGSKYI